MRSLGGSWSQTPTPWVRESRRLHEMLYSYLSLYLPEPLSVNVHNSLEPYSDPRPASLSPPGSSHSSASKQLFLDEHFFFRIGVAGEGEEENWNEEVSWGHSWPEQTSSVLGTTLHADPHRPGKHFFSPRLYLLIGEMGNQIEEKSTSTRFSVKIQEGTAWDPILKSECILDKKSKRVHLLHL